MTIPSDGQHHIRSLVAFKRACSRLNYEYHGDERGAIAMQNQVVKGDYDCELRTGWLYAPCYHTHTITRKVS